MCTKKLSYLLLIVFSYAALIYPLDSAGDNDYSVSKIHPGLLKDAGAIIRNKSVHFEIENQQNAVLTVRQAVTIFKKDKKDYGNLLLNYDSYTDISSLEGKIYDKDGEEIRDLQSSDIKDYSDFIGYSLYDDNRIKYAELYYDKFPYTIEYIYEIKYEGYINWPAWYSRHSRDPVEYSEFDVIVPEDYDLRYWCNHNTVKPELSKENDLKIFHWKAEDLPELSREADYEDIQDLAVNVRIAPSRFNIDGYEGSMLTWKDFGSWYYLLAEGKDILPESALAEINDKALAAGSTREKIVSLYSYMQSRTRYVSIQLGIGSWQPFDAAYVHTNGYGDCKALSNYMISILKTAGITAYPVLIESGEQEIPMISEFPSNQFDHIIVAVPCDKDTIWLECTSQDLPAGCLGWSCENRNALLITPEGGRIIHTPASRSVQNKQERMTTVKMNSSGNAEITSHTKWSGDQHNYALSVSKSQTALEQEKWLKNHYKVPDIQLNKFSFNKKNRDSEEIELDISAVLPRYATVSGNRIFFNPDLADRRTNIPDNLASKISPVKYDYPYLDIDSVHFVLPVKYDVETFPEEVELETSFGRFVSRTKKNNDNSLSYFRLLEIKDYSIPPEKYNEYRNFFAAVVKSDRSQVVLSKK